MDYLQPRQAYIRANTDDYDMIEMIPTYASSQRSLLRSQEDDSKIRPNPIQTSKRWFTGWRAGAYGAALTGIVSLIINIVAVVWLQNHPDSDSKLVQVFKGSCSEVSKMDVWVHLAINAISTILLSGSNYCMQCLCAPTRSDCDRAHAKGTWLDIGVPSIRNLKGIAWSKATMWWLLALSSLPLHLLYNSAFYSSIATNDYSIVLAKSSFLLGEPIGNATKAKDTAQVSVLQFHINDTNIFQRFEPIDCIKQYSKIFLQDYSNLIIISKDDNNLTNSSVLHFEPYRFSDAIVPSVQVYDPFGWICESDPLIRKKVNVPSTDKPNGFPPCDSYVNQVEAIIDNWKPWNHTVDHCLAQRTSQSCSFNGNIPIIITVIVANSIKIILMLIVALKLSGNPLITLGDAIESFLTVSDKSSEGLCLMTRDDAEKFVTTVEPRDATWKSLLIERRKAEILKASTKQRHWASAASVTRWAVTLSLIIVALITVIGFLIAAISAINGNGTSLSTLGFGQVHASAIIAGWAIERIYDPASQILAAIFIANLPQAILSFLYLNLNGLFTTMWSALEWSRFDQERRTLRVSTPKGMQRSTHFLQLPYKIAIPLMIISGLLHWLVSQSIFLAVVANYDSNGAILNPVQIASCGFSPLAMLCVLGLGTLMIIAAIMLGRRRYKSSMPLVGSCSIAIAAACHRPDWDVDAAYCAVQWGAISNMKSADGIGHCCFTSGDVEPIEGGKSYAGRI